jgi:flagellar motility protein MotE (MotC chaperone)
MTHEEQTTKTRRRRGSRALRVGLALILIVKLALVAVWYTGGVSAALALAAETRAPRGGDASAIKAAAADATAAKSADAAQASDGDGGRPAPRQLASIDRMAVDPAAKPAEARALLDAITRRQAELDTRARELAAREERLHLFEQDVVAKVASLEEIEKRLQGRAKAASAAVDAAAESLAKVYGAMKAADAAPILERLDEATVLSIFGRMKEKQIGEILPLMTKEKAIALTRALATSPAR